MRNRLMSKLGLVFVCTLFLFCAHLAFSADISQWRNNRDGLYTETGLMQKWPDAGPKMLWVNENLGDGYSSPIIVEGNIYVSGITNEREFLACLDLTGKEKWRTEYSDIWTKSYPEARTSPTYVDGRIFVISSNGVAASMDAKTGKLLWAEKVHEKYQGDFGRWGAAESPLVVDGKVFVTPTGETTTMVALNAKDGSLVWKSASINEKGAYVSPLMISHNGIKQIVGVGANYIFGVNPDSGEIQWKFNYLETFFGNEGNPKRWVINCNTPTYHDGQIFVTSGYDHAGVMLKLNDKCTDAKLLWKTADLDVHHGHVVLVDGFLYGANWLNNSTGNWTCIDWRTGKKMWEEKWNGKGSTIYAEGMLYIYDEKRGGVGLAKATPKAFELVSSFTVKHGSKAHWAHPVIHNGVLYIRHGEALMAYNIKK